MNEVQLSEETIELVSKLLKNHLKYGIKLLINCDDDDEQDQIDMYRETQGIKKSILEMEKLFKNFTKAEGMNKEDIERLTCTKCGDTKETFSELEYSQGSIVCLDCKKENLESDKIAFDRDMSFR